MAEENSDFVIGFICQKKLSENPEMLHIMPGVQFCESGDKLGQQYTSPEKAILSNKCDIIVVGRGITSSENPVQAAIDYKKSSYDSYLKRIKQ